MVNRNSYFERSDTQIQQNLKFILPSILAKTGINVAQSLGMPPVVGAAIGGAIGGVIVALQEMKEQEATQIVTDHDV